MKAMLSKSVGGPQTLVLEEMPDPTPGAAEVVLDVKACGVNFPDLLMTQRFSLYQDLSIVENLEFVARVYGLADPAGEAQRAIERLGLAGRERQLAGTLSGGWKQRLALGACILPKPELLLLDEPTAGVDPKARRTFWDEIHALSREGLTVLVSTHYMTWAWA